MIKRILICLSIASNLVPFLGYSESISWPDGHYEIQGDVFAQDSNSKLFTYEKSILKKRNTVETVALYRFLDGKPAFRQAGKIADGTLITYFFEDLQSGKSGSVDFTYSSKDGPTALFKLNLGDRQKTDEDSVGRMPVSPGTIVESILMNWDQLLEGKVLSVSMAVVEELEAFSFTLRRDVEASSSTDETFIVKPSSIFIAAIVDPIRIRIQKKPSLMVAEVLGRLPVKRKNGEKLQAFNGRLVLKPPRHLTR